MRTMLLVVTLGIISSLMACQRKEEAATQPAPATTEEQTMPAGAPAGANVGAEGETCGGIAIIECADGLYCAMEPGQCGVADANGTCKTKPGECTGQHMPVCGCDGQTYDNDCKAAQAGVNVQSSGECPKGATQ